MKKLNFETSKGKFVVVDLPNSTHFLKHKGYIVQSCTDKLDLLIKCNKIDNGDTNGFWYIGNTTNEYVLKDITEQQASEVVDSEYNPSNYGEYKPSAIHRLHSIITSNGYYLFENPYETEPTITNGDYDNNGFGDIDKYQFKKDHKEWKEAQDKTFFNPIIFKLV